MDSPINVGDVTTNSILGQLSETHLNAPYRTEIRSAIYSGQEMIQLDIFMDEAESSIKEEVEKIREKSPLPLLRRVQDSYVNVSQIFEILLKIGQFEEASRDIALKNEVIDNPQFLTGEVTTPLYNDLRNHPNKELRGIWIPYDKAVSLALKYDIYDITKELFLVDVHDFERLPRKKGPVKRASENDEKDATVGSPEKKQKTVKLREAFDTSVLSDIIDSYVAENSNYPYALPPIDFSEGNSEYFKFIKQKFGEIFKLNERQEITISEVKDIVDELFKDRHGSYSEIKDIQLDFSGKTALHFAATLGSLNLAVAFVSLGLCSPVRGSKSGETPLISAICVTNSLEKGNFSELLSSVLWPALWLSDNKYRTFLHHLASNSKAKPDASHYYFQKILEWLATNQTGKSQNSLEFLSKAIINNQEEESGNTCLHIAAENEDLWFIRILVSLNADVNIANKTGIRPKDLDIIKSVQSEQENGFEKSGSCTESELYLLELISTTLKMTARIPPSLDKFDFDGIASEQITTSQLSYNQNSASGKLFHTIIDLLQNTNKEYSNVVESKKTEIKDLNRALLDATIVTANNRFIAKQIPEKLMQLDNLRLQMANVSNRISSLQKTTEEEFPHEAKDLEDSIDADEAYVIEPIYRRKLNGESIDDLKQDNNFMELLPATDEIKKQIQAYEKLNLKIQEEINSLSSYNELTAKFKKVVSFCTGVDMNEVDELLDGLLEAVEGQT